MEMVVVPERRASTWTVFSLACLPVLLIILDQLESDVLVSHALVCIQARLALNMMTSCTPLPTRRSPLLLLMGAMPEPLLRYD